MGRTRRGRIWGRATPMGAATMTAALLLGACGHPQPGAGYGALPKWLPVSSSHADSILTGSVARPALTSEGDAVLAQMAPGTVTVTVTGPQVPGEGLPYQPAATTCTWTVTLAHADHLTPIAVKDFTSIDQLGTVYHPVLVAGQRRPPAVLAPGQTVTFELRVVMRTGEGLIRWAPDSRHILAEWDFEVEVD